MRAQLGKIGAEARRAASASIALRLTSLPIWQTARIIGLFASRLDEPEISSLFSEVKIFAYPKIAGDTLRFVRVGQASELAPGAFDLLEPTGTGEASPDLILVPGLAFDQWGGRLGRGKGFYDRWLTEHPETIAAGVCFDLQIVDQVPTEPHDRQVQMIITDSRTIQGSTPFR